MTRNKPPALAMQLDRCDVCGDKYHRADLVRTQVEFLNMKAENFFLYSSYDGTNWVVDTASDAGSTSYGNRCDNARTTLDSDNDISYINGVQTWTGDGVFRLDVITDLSLSSTYDLTFSAQVGPHEQNTSPEMTVEMGITNNDGSVTQAIKTFTIKGTTRVWFNEEVATLNGYGLGTGDYYFYLEITNDGSWWVDELQLELNVNSLPGHEQGRPENFVRTSGSFVSSSINDELSEQQLMTSRKVCKNCAEYILSKSERFGRTEESPIDEPVDSWAQEI